MNGLTMTDAAHSSSPFNDWRDRLTGLAATLLPMSLLLLVQRLGIAAIFFYSGRTKVEGWFTITDSAYELFRNEYAGVPRPPERARVIATMSEHLFHATRVTGHFGGAGCTAQPCMPRRSGEPDTVG